MPSAIKAAQLADQIRDYVAVWLLKDFPNAFLSIDQVTLSGNMLTATIWLVNSGITTVHMGDVAPKAKEYQKKLSSQMKRRSIPRLEFRLVENTF